MKIKKSFIKAIIILKEEIIDKWNVVFIGEFLLILLLILLEKSFAISFISIIIHEFSHIIVARIKGSRFSSIQFHIYGSKVELLDVDELTYKDKLTVYIAGPLSNLLIIVFFIIINIHIPIRFINEIISLNLGLAMFNLLPAYPLDGARILEVLLSRIVLFRKAREIISYLSYIVAAGFILLFIMSFIKYDKLNLSMILVGIIVIYITNMEKKAVMYILMGNIYKKRKKLIKNNYIENRIISVYYKIGLVNLMTIVDKNRFNIFYVLDDDLKVLFTLREDELIEALKKYGNITLEEYYVNRV